jgi:hypothetical protein
MNFICFIINAIWKLFVCFLFQEKQSSIISLAMVSRQTISLLVSSFYSSTSRTPPPTPAPSLAVLKFQQKPVT